MAPGPRASERRLTPPRPTSFPRFLFAAGACLVGAAALGAYPTWVAAGEAGFVAMAVAAGIAILGAVVGHLPTLRTASAPAEARVQAALLGIMARLLLTGAAVFAFVRTDAVPARLPFLLWVGIDYMTLLALETATVVRLARGLDGGPART